MHLSTETGWGAFGIFRESRRYTYIFIYIFTYIYTYLCVYMHLSTETGWGSIVAMGEGVSESKRYAYKFIYMYVYVHIFMCVCAYVYRNWMGQYHGHGWECFGLFGCLWQF